VSHIGASIPVASVVRAVTGDIRRTFPFESVVRACPVTYEGAEADAAYRTLDRAEIFGRALVKVASSCSDNCS
jgi:hypothetical protein